MLKKLYNEMDQAFRKMSFSSSALLVHGEGNLQPKLLLIGEAPGEQEVLQGKPFVGKAGKNLSEFLEILGLSREEIFITNVVKYRPTKLSKAGRIVNRPPNREEITFFTPYLKQEIRLLQPELIVTLGNVALGVFSASTIGNVHGSLQPWESDGKHKMVFPLYHPASIIYNPSLKQVYHDDLVKLRTIIENISIDGRMV